MLTDTRGQGKSRYPLLVLAHDEQTFIVRCLRCDSPIEVVSTHELPPDLAKCPTLGHFLIVIDGHGITNIIIPRLILPLILMPSLPTNIALGIRYIIATCLTPLVSVM